MSVSIASAAERIVASSSAAILLTDGAQRCVYMNPAAERLCGPLASLASRALHDALPHVGRDGAPCSGGCALAAALAGHGLASGDVRIARDGGRLVGVTFVASAESEGGGMILEAWEVGADGPIARAPERGRASAVVASPKMSSPRGRGRSLHAARGR
jgi:PAS domain-containing protein